MKLCIPSMGSEGLAAAVAGHLGRARFMTLVDTTTTEVVVVPNTPSGRFCSPEPLAGSGVEAVVCAHAGRGAVERLLAAGVRVLATDARWVHEAVKSATAGGLRRLETKDACSGGHGAGASGHSCRRG